MAGVTNVARFVCVCLAIVVGSKEVASGFTRPLLGYHLCQGPVLVNRTVMVPYTVSFSKLSLCPAGWLVQLCYKTAYRTAYRSVAQTQLENGTVCCAGYERSGPYCVLPLNKSSVFLSKPGDCPVSLPGGSATPCAVDTDCANATKCCPDGAQQACGQPVAQAATGYYSVELTTTIEYSADLLNPHSASYVDAARLVHSMVSGLLEGWGVAAVYVTGFAPCPLGFWRSTEAFLIVAFRPPRADRLALGIKLQELPFKAPRVMFARLKDVNECKRPELNSCQRASDCVNKIGSHACTGEPVVTFATTTVSTSSSGTPRWTSNAPTAITVASPSQPTVISSPPPTTPCGPDPVMPPYAVVTNMTATTFSLSWDSGLTQQQQLQQTYELRLWAAAEQGLEPLELSSQEPRFTFTGLQPGIVYSVNITSRRCGKSSGALLQKVKTVSQEIKGTVRITNRNFTAAMANTSSPEFANMSQEIMDEIIRGLPPSMAALVRQGLLTIKITELRSGSVVATIEFIVAKNVTDVTPDQLFTALTEALNSSGVLQFDLAASNFTDLDECSSATLNDCAPNATCSNVVGSYNCSCNPGSVDPSRSYPGRTCLAPVIPATSVAPGIGNNTGNSSAAPPTTACGPDPVMPPYAVVTNMTATTFSLSWDSGLTQQQQLQQTYELRLWAAAEQGLEPLALSSLEPRFTFTGLQPGIVYSVNIIGRRCGKSSDALLQKVKTVSQELKGSVRIINRNFTAAMANASSAEFANISNEIIAQILAGLQSSINITDPVTIRVTELRSGSIVAILDLILSGNLSSFTPEQVLNAFKQALNSTGGLLFDPLTSNFTDLDECSDATLNDCAPNATCSNVFGSYNCSCNPGFVDPSPSYPGRTCLANTTAQPVSTVAPAGSAAASANATTPANGTTTQPNNSSSTLTGGVIPPAISTVPSNASTAATPGNNETASGAPTVPSNASNASTAATPGNNATAVPSNASTAAAPVSPITVKCDGAFLYVELPKSKLELFGVQPSDMYMGLPGCTGQSVATSDILEFKSGWSECATKVTSNGSHTLLSNVVKNGGGAASVLAITVFCAISNNVNATGGFLSTGSFLINDTLYGTGMYGVTVEMLQNNSAPVTEPILGVNDTLTLRASVSSANPNVTAVMQACWATPSLSGESEKFDLIVNKCPNTATDLRVIESGKSKTASFNITLFQYIKFPTAFIHCSIGICLTSVTNCTPVCNGISRAYDTGSVRASSPNSNVVDFGPIHFRDATTSATTVATTAPSTEAAVSPWRVATIVLGVLLGFALLVLVAIAGYRAGAGLHHRRSARYAIEERRNAGNVPPSNDITNRNYRVL